MKTAKNFRLSDQTLGRIAWISGRTGKSATDIIETAVEAMVEDVRKKQRAHLVSNGNGWYDLVIDGVPVVGIEQIALSKMGKHADELLSPEGGNENLFGLVTLAGAISGGRMKVYRKNIQTVMAPHVAPPVEA